MREQKDEELKLEKRGKKVRREGNEYQKQKNNVSGK
jgi:hypothetical protein